MSKLIPLLETIFMNHGGTPEHWRVSSKVLNEKAEESKHFIAFIKNKLKELDVEIQSMALDLVDYFMDEGKMPLFTQVSSKDFLMTLVNILKNRGASIIQEKILYLLKKWGIKFEKQKDIIPTFTDIYDQLKKNNTVFPNVSSPPYFKYLYSKDEVENKNNNNFNNNVGNNMRNSGSGNGKNSSNLRSGSNYPVLDNQPFVENPVVENSEKTVDYSYKNYLDISADKFESKYKKFVNELNVWMENITLANETIENTDYKSEIDEFLRSIILAVRAAEKQLISIIESGFEEEDLMNICLIINDDINKTLTRYECLKKKKKPEPFLTGFLESDSINPKFKVKKPEPKIKQPVPKINVSNNQQQQKPNNQNLLDLNSQPNPVSNSNIPVKDVNDIFDLFGSSVKISDNNNNNGNNNLNKSANMGNSQNNNNNELNPNNMIDLVTNLAQNQQKQKQNENIIDLTKMNNNNINNNANANPNNFPSKDIKISSEPQQNKKVIDLEEMLKAAYSNSGNNNQNDNNYINQQQNNQGAFPMPMYGLPANGSINNQYQNPSLMNPNPMMPMPITNGNQAGNFGMPAFPMDVNGNYLNNQIPMNYQMNPQGYNNPKNAFNNQSQNIPQSNYPQMPMNPNFNNQPQQYPQQNQVDNNYPDFFN